MKKAFTIIELLVAMGLIVILLVGSGYVFRTAVEAEQTARATAEIARKLRGITEQLNADFKGLRKDAELFVAGVGDAPVENPPGTIVGYENRVDRIMFFANGDFVSYGDNPKIEGNIARITYMIARPALTPNALPEPQDRILARVQHIYTADTTIVPSLPPTVTPPASSYFPNLTAFNEADFRIGENYYEYDMTNMQEWKQAPMAAKYDIISIIAGLRGGTSTIVDGGVLLDKSDPYSLHKLFCEGVGEFAIQYWYDDGVNAPRWVPEVDPDGDGDLSDTDFVLKDLSDPSQGLDPINYPARLYLGDDTLTTFFGRAFKFTFTLYDSYGVFPDGKTFSHIVYLD